MGIIIDFEESKIAWINRKLREIEEREKKIQERKIIILKFTGKIIKGANQIQFFVEDDVR